MIGIYAIRNTLTGQVYIGRSVQVHKRLYGHARTLKLGTHDNPYLQASFNKYGEASFTMGPLIVCSRDDLPFYERLLIEGYRSDDPKKGFNLTVAIEDRLTHTAAAKAAISAFQKVFQATNHYAMTPEIAEKIASKLRGRVGCNKGRVWPDEVKAKFGAPKGNKHRYGRTFTTEQRARISAGVSQYYAENSDAREALSLVRKGRPSPRLGAVLSDETKAKISLSKRGTPAHNKGVPMTDEQKAKLLAANLGKTMSLETRQKISESLRLRATSRNRS